MNNYVEKSIRKKKSIVDVIVGLMDEEGLKNVTVKEICKACNISVGTFYHYFKSKDAIVDEMYGLMDAYFIQNKNSINNHLTVAEKIIDFTNHFGYYVEQWGYHANLLVTSSYCKRVPKGNPRPPRQIYRILEEIIQKGIDNHEFNRSLKADELSDMIFVLIRGYLVEWVKKGENYPARENMVKHTTYFIGFLCDK